jgi:hypothetical protein
MTIRTEFDIPGVPPAWWKNEPFREWAGRAIQKDAVANESYRNLLAAGVKEGELLEFLVGRAVWVFRARGPRPWHFGSGMTAKNVAYFPKRLQTVAEEIEKLNKCLAYCGLFSGQIRVPAKGFDQIPELLQRYAAFVALAARRRNRFRRGRALDELIQFVREETGKPRFGELSNLLTAVAHDVGVENDFSPDAMKMRASRIRKHPPTK